MLDDRIRCLLRGLKVLIKRFFLAFELTPRNRACRQHRMGSPRHIHAVSSGGCLLLLLEVMIIHGLLRLLRLLIIVCAHWCSLLCGLRLHRRGLLRLVIDLGIRQLKLNR